MAALVFLIVGLVHADDSVNLMGSKLTIEEALSKSEIVFVGKLVSLGERDNSVDHGSLGPEYPNGKALVWEKLKGTFDTSASIGIYPNEMLKEETPKAGNSYIFFIKHESFDGAFFAVTKLLPVTNDNIAAVKAAIVQTEKNPPSGSSH
jgi:hypothetical protein